MPIVALLLLHYKFIYFNTTMHTYYIHIYIHVVHVQHTTYHAGTCQLHQRALTLVEVGDSLSSSLAASNKLFVTFKDSSSLPSFDN